MPIKSKPIHTTLTGSNSNILPVTASSVGFDLATNNYILYNPSMDIWIPGPVPGSGADPGASYLVVSTTASLTNERALAAGPGITFTDGGANGVFTISASLLAGSNITINQIGNAYAISGASGGGNSADISASYVLLSSTGSLPNSKVLTAGPGIIISSSATTINVSASLLAGPNITINQVGNSYAITGAAGGSSVTGPLTASVGNWATYVSTSLNISNSSYIEILTLPFYVTQSYASIFVASNVGYTKTTTGTFFSTIKIDNNFITQSHGNDCGSVLKSSQGGFVDVVGTNLIISASAGWHTASLLVKNDAGSFTITPSSDQHASLVVIELTATGTGSANSVQLPKTHLNVGFYKLSSQTIPDSCGAAYFVPGEHYTNSGLLRAIVSTSTGSNAVIVQLYNATSQSYVHIGGPGVIGISSSATTPTLITSSNLLSATNFNPLTASVYEVQVYGSGITPISILYGSEMVFA